VDDIIGLTLYCGAFQSFCSNFLVKSLLAFSSPLCKRKCCC